MHLSESFEWLELLGCYVACWSYGWLLGCLAVVREFWLVVRAFCSCQRVLVVC